MNAYKALTVSTAALILTSACSRSSLVVQNPPSPPGFPTSVDRPAAHAAASGPMNGDLPKPLGSMTGEELWTFVKDMKKGGGMTAPRPCRNLWSCKLLGKRTDVNIVASEDARLQDSANAGPNGTIVAVAENLGNYTSELYGFQPSQGNIRHVYAFVVFNKTATQGPTYVLTEITKNGGSYSHAEPNGTNAFTLCNHPKEWPSSQAAFQTCSGLMAKGVVNHGAIQMGMTDFGIAGVYLKSIALLASRLYAEDDPPGWITCGAGCCTLDAVM